MWRLLHSGSTRNRSHAANLSRYGRGERMSRPRVMRIAPNITTPSILAP